MLGSTSKGVNTYFTHGMACPAAVRVQAEAVTVTPLKLNPHHPRLSLSLFGSSRCILVLGAMYMSMMSFWPAQLCVADCMVG
jgi:hypothetical protein